MTEKELYRVLQMRCQWCGIVYEGEIECMQAIELRKSTAYDLCPHCRLCGDNLIVGECNG